MPQFKKELCVRSDEDEETCMAHFLLYGVPDGEDGRMVMLHVYSDKHCWTGEIRDESFKKLAGHENGKGDTLIDQVLVLFKEKSDCDFILTPESSEKAKFSIRQKIPTFVQKVERLSVDARKGHMTDTLDAIIEERASEKAEIEKIQKQSEKLALKYHNLNEKYTAASKKLIASRYTRLKAMGKYYHIVAGDWEDVVEGHDYQCEPEEYSEDSDHGSRTGKDQEDEDDEMSEEEQKAAKSKATKRKAKAKAKPSLKTQARAKAVAKPRAPTTSSSSETISTKSFVSTHVKAPEPRLSDETNLDLLAMGWVVRQSRTRADRVTHVDILCEGNRYRARPTGPAWARARTDATAPDEKQYSKRIKEWKESLRRLRQEPAEAGRTKRKKKVDDSERSARTQARDPSLAMEKSKRAAEDEGHSPGSKKRRGSPTLASLASSQSTTSTAKKKRKGKSQESSDSDSDEGLFVL